MTSSLQINANNFELNLLNVSSFIPDRNRDRFYDAIPDFTCWQTNIDLEKIDSNISKLSPFSASTLITLPGKLDSPDRDAMLVAERVLSRPSECLAAVLGLGDSFELDEWMLNSLWFPYQAYGTRWYATFITEYDGNETFAFSTPSLHSQAITCEREFGNQTSMSFSPSVARYCIGHLVHYHSDNAFVQDLLDFIRRGKIYGVEIIPTLRVVIQQLQSSLEPWAYKHLMQLLDRFQ